MNSQSTLVYIWREGVVEVAVRKGRKGKGEWGDEKMRREKRGEEREAR